MYEVELGYFVVDLKRSRWMCHFRRTAENSCKWRGASVWSGWDRLGIGYGRGKQAQSGLCMGYRKADMHGNGGHGK